MKKERKDPTLKEKAELLREYNHRCAICGGVPRNFHHIDEDRIMIQKI
jgi:predicted restriction endonuclease